MNKILMLIQNAHTVILPQEMFEYCKEIYNQSGEKAWCDILNDKTIESKCKKWAKKDTRWATVVGTTTGGDGIGINPCIMSLPNSGLVIQFTMDMGLNPDGTANEETHTAPDIYIEQSKKDYPSFIKWQESHKKSGDLANPYDTVLNSVLRICK